MGNELTFVKTQSLADFKTEQGVGEIKMFQSEKTGKCFFTYGFEKGACSRKVLDGELTNPVISQVCAADTGDMFYLLHPQGEGGALHLGTL